MQIIIVGCGKVGKTLAEQLQEEANVDLTLIDISAESMQSVSENVDALMIEGNGASINTLREAGIDKADLLIAVTGSDELNLLCCLIAQKSGHCHTIARVRNPVYFHEVEFIRERLGLTMIINPELSAAQEISRLLRLPSAIKIDTFARRRIELLKFKVLPEFELNGLSVSELADRFHLDILVCGIENKDEVIIPGGNSLIHDGDMVSILATPENTSAFFRKIGLKARQVKNTLIVGGGTIAIYLAQELLAMNIDVKIIESNEKRCEMLSDLLPEATVIHGDGTNHRLLMEEGLALTESFIPMTDVDEENIFLSLYAKTRTKAKLIAKVNRMDSNEIIDSLDIGSVVYPKYVTADRILTYVRAMRNSYGSNVETLYHIMDGKAEALEFQIREESPALNKPLSTLKLKSNLLVGCLNRGGKIRIPRGQDSLKLGDTVVIVTTHRGLHDINDILA
ncbi:MAG: Trk system potassium transporter TrkA [Blautia sp.]|nr:Trk system potassium transporter TrkA [Blautia sp.]